MSKGQLQHDLWGVKPPSDRWDWNALRADIAAHGVRNSLLVAPMPTASTSQARHPFPVKAVERERTKALSSRFY